MRRSKTVKNVRAGTLCLLLASSALFFFDAYKEPCFKVMVEKKLGELSGRRIKFEMTQNGRIEGGVFTNVVVKNITMSYEPARLSVDLERMEIPYRVWYPLLEKNKFLAELFPKKAAREFFLFFGEKNIGLKGFLSVSESAPGKYALTGSASVREERVSLNGEIVKISDSLQNLDLRFGGKAGLKISVDSEKKLAPFNAEVRHASLFGMDISCDIDGQFYGWDGNNVYGNISVRNLIVNYKPSKDITVVFDIDKKSERLSIVKFNIGEEIKVSGSVGMKEPHYTKMSLYIQDTHLEDFNFSSSEKSLVRGVVDGQIHLEGALNEIITKGHINARDGYLGDIEYDTLFATLAGKGKIIRIEDGRLFKGDGSLILAGEIDFGKFKEGKIFENADLSVDKNMLIWKGWQVTKKKDASVVEAKKNLDGDFNIKFKFKDEKNTNKLHNDKKDEVELEYKLHKNESFKMNLKSDEEFVGLEHKVKF